jgi:HAD superfamily hydrolase (TIGR01549 family)
MNLTDVEAILFDMDGTLIEHTWSLDQVSSTTFEHVAGQVAPTPVEVFFEVYWEKSTDMWHLMADGVLDGDLARLYSFKNTLRTLGHDVALAEPMLQRWEALILQEVMPFRDTYQTLQKLRPRYKTGIITNGYRTLQRAKIQKYSLADCVDVTLVSEEVGSHKPDPDIFYQALAMLDHVPPERAVFVGDSPAADIDGARNAGLIPILMDPRDRVAAPIPGVVKIRALQELLDLLPGS